MPVSGLTLKVSTFVCVKGNVPSVPVVVPLVVPPSDELEEPPDALVPEADDPCAKAGSGTCA